MATSATRAAQAAVWSRPARFEIKAYALEFNGVKGILGGYLTLYDNPETGQPYIDPYLDVCVPGFMNKTIQELYQSQKSRTKEFLLPYLWQHNHSEIIGGVKHLSEDSQGVIFETQLAKGVARAQECFALHEQGMPMGVSYGYDPIRTQPQSGLRYLKEVALREISSVTFPAHEFANVTSTKNFFQGMSLKQPMQAMPMPARMFDDIMEDRRERDLMSDFYTMQDVLATSLLECVNDVTMVNCDACIDDTITQYSVAIKDWYPEYLAAIAAPEPDGVSDSPVGMDMPIPMVMSATFALNAIKSMDLKTGKILSGRNRERIAEAIAHMSNKLADLQAVLDEATAPEDTSKSLRTLFTLPVTRLEAPASPQASTPPPAAPTSLFTDLLEEMTAFTKQ